MMTMTTKLIGLTIFRKVETYIYIYI